MDEIFKLIPLMCTIISVAVVVKTYNNNNNKDDKVDYSENIKRDTKIETKLDMILQSNGELKNDIKDIHRTFDKVNERLTRVEESTKQAHKRLDNLVSK